MSASAPTAKNEDFAFMAVLVFNLMNRKVLFVNRKDIRNC